MNSQFWNDFIIEGTEDYVGLWLIIRELEREHPTIEKHEIQVMALDLIREILETGFMRIGMFEYNNDKKLEYKLWELGIDSIIYRLKTEWDELGKTPNIGDIAWLITTEKGEKEAEKIIRKRKKLDSETYIPHIFKHIFDSEP